MKKSIKGSHFNVEVKELILTESVWTSLLQCEKIAYEFSYKNVGQCFSELADAIEEYCVLHGETIRSSSGVESFCVQFLHKKDNSSESASELLVDFKEKNACMKRCVDASYALHSVIDDMTGVWEGDAQSKEAQLVLNCKKCAQMFINIASTLLEDSKTKSYQPVSIKTGSEHKKSL